jgi:co-chaperonin GroES (HSP10)
MIQAIGQHVFVQKDPIHHLQVGGILIPEQSERTPRFSPTVLGTVVSAGQRCWSVKAGDRVALKNIAGDDWLWNGQYFTLLRERDCIGLVEEE